MYSILFFLNQGACILSVHPLHFPSLGDKYRMSFVPLLIDIGYDDIERQVIFDCVTKLYQL